MRRFTRAVWPIFVSLMLAVSLGAAVPLIVAAQDDDDDDRGSRRRGVGDLIVTLTDDQQRIVAGACFQLIDAQARVIAESCDTRASGDRRPNNGRTGFFRVPAGTYTLRLVSLPSGIQPVDIRPVEIKRNRETNEAVTIIIAGEVEESQQPPAPTIPETPTAPQPTATQPPATQPAPPDEPNVGTLIVTLRDDSGSRIALACFELINASGESFIRCDTAEFDIYPANGNTGFFDVPADTYTLRLIEAPGVVRFDTWEVTVAANTETKATVSANTEEEPEAPDEVEESAENETSDDDVDEDDDDRRANQAIVRLVDGVDPVVFANENGFTLLRSIPGRNVHLLGLNTTVSDDDEVTDLDKDDGTEWAEFNYTSQAPEGRPRRFFTSGGRSAPMAADQPAPAALDLDAASCVTGAGVLVAVLDTGIDAGHPAFNSQVLGGYNAVSDNGNTADVGDGLDNDGDGVVDEMTGHGTHVAGIIHKVAPGASLLPVKVLDSDGVGDAFWVALGIYYAVDQGSQVVNLSLSSTTDARVINEATAWAAGQGAMVVAAAGNENLKQPEEYPATYDGAYSVAASAPNDAKADFSNYNAAVDLSAPGTNIVSAFPGGGYVAWSGTSMAAPFVSGAAALLWERLGGGPAQIRSALAAGADPMVYTESNWNEHLGAGRLNVGQSVNCGG